MKWLKSTTQKTWYANGKKIPQCVTPHNDYLQLEDADYVEMEKLPVIASLIKAGGILVLSEEPAELKNSIEALQGNQAALVAQNTELAARVKELEAQAQGSTNVDVEAIKAEAQEEIRVQAVKELQEKEDEIAELKKQLKAAEKKAAKTSAE